jgi:hypothetical protein
MVAFTMAKVNNATMLLPAYRMSALLKMTESIIHLPNPQNLSEQRYEVWIRGLFYCHVHAQFSVN